MGRIGKQPPSALLLVDQSRKKQLREETANWERFAGVMQRVLTFAE